MKDQITVSSTEEFKTQSTTVSVCEGKIVFIFADPTQEPKQLKDGFWEYTMKPIIISETEERQEGDVCYDVVYDRIVTADKITDKFVNITSKQEGLTHSNISNLRKVLALPEHFTPEQLQDIVGGKYADGDSVMVECEEDEDRFSNRDDYVVKSPLTLHKAEWDAQEWKRLHRGSLSPKESWDEVLGKVSELSLPNGATGAIWKHELLEILEGYLPPTKK